MFAAGPTLSFAPVPGNAVTRQAGVMLKANHNVHSNAVCVTGGWMDE
jgi:hypothetical protein